MYKRILCLLWFIWLATGVSGQAADTISFVNIDVKDGLSNNAVTCLVQDHYGFMWMGTYDGLNRYDGTGFRVFRNQLEDPSSLVNNHVTAIKEGRREQLWVGTLKGLSMFDYRDFRFHKVYYRPIGQDGLHEVDARVKDLVADTAGNVLVATENNGLLVRTKGEAVFREVTFQGNARQNVTALCPYQADKYFVYLKDRGLCLYDIRRNTLTLFASQLAGATRLLYEPRRKALLIGTEDGLEQYEEKTGRIAIFSPQLNHCNITHLLRDKEGTLWISTDGNGVAQLKKDGNPLKDIRFTKEGHDLFHLESSAVYSVYEDRSGGKWIATLRGGVSFLNARRPLFTTIRKNEFDPQSLVSNFILSFCEDSSQNVWIGTDGGGISYWNPRKKAFKNYVHHEGDSRSISGNYIVSILKDTRNRIWVASFNGGIDRKSPQGNGFIHYDCYNAYRNKYDKNLWKLFEDSHHHIWAGSTMGDALFLYNETKNRFEVFDNTLINIHTLYEDAEGNLWAGNYGQLIKIDTLHKRHTYIPVGFPVRAILQDHTGRLWVGTEGGGLLQYQPITGRLLHYTQQEGLPSNSILNLLEDKEGRIWCSTYNGLSVLDVQNHRFSNYTVNDGLQSNQFSYNAALQLSDGSFLFGGINGFNHFVPELINKAIHPIPLLVTDFRVNNTPVEETGYLGKGRTPVNFTSLTIPYRDANFAVHFTGLDYDAPGSTQYGYYLEGWDKSWTNNGNSHMATYSRLYEGEYRLHLAVMQPGGKPILSTERIISIEVLPPWYRSWWAYTFYLLAFALLVYAYQKYRQRQTRLLYEMKITRLNAKTERDLNERKIAFFTNISHEFRTMLTLIINPMKELMKHADETGQPDTIKTAYKNSRRMLSLIGQLLLFRKADSAETQLHISQVDLRLLCREVFESFAFQAKTQQIDYRLIVQPAMDEKEAEENKKEERPTENISADLQERISGQPGQVRAVGTMAAGRSSTTMIYGDAEKIEILLFNLISNAFKYTPEGGRIHLTLRPGAARVEVLLVDSGKGIAEQEKEKIFVKFYQQSGLDGRSRSGFGIGLFLVKDFITRHHGSVDFESQPGKGTTFRLVFLKGKAHFEGLPVQDREIYDHGLAQEILDVAANEEANDPEPRSEEAPADAGKMLPENIEVVAALLTEKKTLLIADDNPEIRAFVCALFRDAYHLLEADNGIKAMQMIEQQLPDLVILDLVMPGKYGDEICQIMKESPVTSHIPVIILTAEASADIKLRCVESGADDYITKPFEQELLLARVSNLLKTKSNLQKYFYNEITLQENHQKISAEDKAFLDRCIAIIEEHLDDEQFEIKILADSMCMSHSSLYKRIHYSSGYSVTGFIRFIRLRKAAELFISSHHNVNETAFMVGFGDVKYFRSQFQKLFGMTPSTYIKKFRRPFTKSFSKTKPGAS